MLNTIWPGEYPGRTPHIHVKVTPPGGSTLTTQLYLPIDRNASDGIFNASLVMDVRDTPTGKDATFTFVIRSP